MSEWPLHPRACGRGPASHRSRAHLCSVALEVVKVNALLAPGPVLQAG
ncbi:hypothetical protein [Streptomyces sp. CS207]|nr:hypothetical protein [Streptomyces sp. CS207]